MAVIGTVRAEEAQVFDGCVGLHYVGINTDLPIDYNEFQDAYKGSCESFRAYAKELFDECYLHGLPETVQNYIDYDAFARDLLSDGYSTQNDPTGGVFVFGP